MKKKNRNGSAKNNKSAIVPLPNGKEEFFLAKEFILRGETEVAIPILLRLLNTTSRLPAALELAYYFFKLENYYAAEPYLNILLQEEKNEVILKQVRRMKLYLIKKGKIENQSEFPIDYYERQIIDYQTEATLNFIKDNRISQAQKYENNKFFYFLTANQIVENITPWIKTNSVLHGYDALDKYYIEASNIGVTNDTLASTIEITTIKDTKNIVDILPVKKEKSRKLIIPNPPIDWK